MNYEFVNRMLHPGEEISYRTRLHPMILIKPVIAFLAAIVGASFLPQEVMPMAAALIIVSCGPYAVVVLCSLFVGDVAVTNQRVVLRQGLLAGQVSDVLLHKIEGIETTRDPVASSGSVRLQIAGGMIRTIGFVRDPDTLVAAIEQARKRLTSRR